MAGDERCSALGFSISSVRAQSCPTLCDSTDCSQVPLSMEFSRQEYWSELPFPPPGDLPDPRIKLVSLTSPALAGGFLPLEPSGKFRRKISHIETGPFKRD